MFNKDAAIQSIDYIVKTIGTTDIIKVLKLLFFAERYHIRKYARSISEDTFYAMKKGPVPSNTYDLIKKNNIQELSITSKEISSNNYFKTLEDYEDLSTTDIEALDFAVKNFGDLSSKQLIDKTHDYKEWNRFVNELKANNTSIKINPEDYFLDTEECSSEYNDIPMETVKLSQDMFYGRL
ncbi:Panacea domain-containing protein [Campylobacter fetus]|uniref:Panacea domain-containing protein n=1 Tax=Campylobacter fetus TaxID=196 RepID=UPI000FC9FE82|nr:Panacea domain-containing protein [Campylobacter fetus]RUT51007.1 hypothetical protein BWK67_00340 [Campylobacter fetus]RUT51735.1 hypothetical protein BWK51_00340 [Campylobacter fetus]